MIPIYVLLTFARGHDVSYLNGIFQMKNSEMPIFITQPYMYIANNYDNLSLIPICYGGVCSGGCTSVLRLPSR